EPGETTGQGGGAIGDKGGHGSIIASRFFANRLSRTHVGEYAKGPSQYPAVRPWTAPRNPHPFALSLSKGRSGCRGLRQAQPERELDGARTGRISRTGLDGN